VVLEPFPGGLCGASLFFADRFVIEGSIREARSDEIADRPKQMNHGG
jgi:hypothetical protein